MKNWESSVVRRWYLNEEVIELDMTNSGGREFHTDMIRFEKKWLRTLVIANGTDRR